MTSLTIFPLAFGVAGPQDVLVIAGVIVLVVLARALADYGKRLGGGPGGPKAA